MYDTIVKIGITISLLTGFFSGIKKMKDARRNPQNNGEKEFDPWSGEFDNGYRHDRRGVFDLFVDRE